MQLIQITDMHMHREPGEIRQSCVNTDDSLAAVLASIKNRGQIPALIAATGDLAQDPHPEIYNRFGQMVSLLDAPVVTLPGNHDDRAMMSASFSDGSVSCCGELQLGEWQLVFLDTSVPGEVHGSLGQEQLDNLIETISSTSASHILIFMHHHPYPVGTVWLDDIGLENSDLFWDAVGTSARVRGVVCGHIHQQLDCIHKGIRMLGTPSTCVQFVPFSEESDFDDRPPGYRVIELNDDGSIDTRVEWVPLP
ncbi:3',5'-cyclic-AMP phosphodiesterase [Solemya velum gill symbiont]|nr:3',5'-cyclic-AMP phosphodiesterase [Solemya velum gill symbiont]OOY34098.1 hypothetical protein BOV88_11770 [Solemya velum gill symbiont]OOY36754.1 hypothetical protein BOV89_10900 [Solemya velum gill symbiont]OOY39415.1 hypothetical protein BOV90_09585 [Solemya velum gill symbiont]OOY44415.1 hypothetical protein BOV91_01415 [Solemya velum gill symbiont]OOY45920.1 hypothetical protein BOV92_04115 [Solemya velum gill symbiont]